MRKQQMIAVRFNRGFLRLVLQRRPNTDLYFLLICQTLSVAMVTGILLFSSGIEQLIYRESSEMLAADTVVESSRAIPAAWRSYLAKQNASSDKKVSEVRLARFMSMLFSGESMHLTDIRAVTSGYPLRGKLTAADKKGLQPIRQLHAPARGRIWLDETAIDLLGLETGDSVELGDISLNVEKVLHDEPGSALPSIGFSGRALMHYDDLQESGLLQPGSRVTYQWMLAGPDASIAQLSLWLSNELTEHESITSHREGDERTQIILERVRSYISLGSVMAVLLTGIAAMMTAARYMEGQQDQVAIMRALGAGRPSLFAYYLIQFGAYSFLAVMLGYLLGYFAQTIIFEWLSDWVKAPITIDPAAFVAGAVTALFCLLCFALPTVFGLLRTSPMRLLRAQSSSTSQLKGIMLFAMGFLLLMIYYSRNWQITLWVYGGILLLALIVWIAMRLLVVLIKTLTRPQSTQAMPLPLRMGLGAFCRQTQQVQLRTVLLATTVTLLSTTWIMRNGLLDEWQAQLPQDAPNFFALDIAPDAARDFEMRLIEQGFPTEPMYPVARARLVSINGEDITAFGIRNARTLAALDREMVLTEAQQVPPGNKIVAGIWHGERTAQQQLAEGLQVSVEAEFAGRLGLKLGDQLQFSFAGQQHKFIVSSFRELNWNSMKPNFYFVLEPPGIRVVPYTYMTSFRVLAGSKLKMREIARQANGVTLIDVGLMIEKIRAILAQVSLAVELIAAITVVAGILVVVASLRMSLRVRVQEYCIMRALGASKRTLSGSLLVELATTGFVAALAGMLTASVLVAGLGSALFDLQLFLPLDVWLLLPWLLLVIVTAIGYWVLRPVLTQSPVQLWRIAT